MGAQAMQPAPPPEDPKVFYGGKTAGIADVADKVLRGWMAGKYIGEQKMREKAAQTIGTMKDAVDTAGQAYKAAVEGGDPKKIEAAGNVLKQQWDEYNKAREQYVIPQDMGQKKTTGQKVGSAAKKAVMPQGPELYLQAALNASKQINPLDLYGPSKKEQQESKLTDLQVKGEQRKNDQDERKDAATKNYEAILQKPEKDLTPQDKKLRDTYEQLYLGKTKDQLFQDTILDKVTGNQPLSEFERTKAEQMGLIKPAVTSTQVRTITGAKGQPVTQLVAIGPDGKMAGQPVTLPGTDWIPPNQAQMAGQVINAEVSAYARLAQKASGNDASGKPNLSDKDAYAMALGMVAKGKNPAMNWAMENEQKDVMNRAIGQLIKNHTHAHTDKDSGQPVQQPDALGYAVSNELSSIADDGRYMWNATLNKQDPGWWSKMFGGQPTYAGSTPEQMQKYDKQARAELRAVLKQQNKALSDWQIDQLVPETAFGKPQGKPGQPGQPQGAGNGMQPAPPQPGQGAAENAPQGAQPGMGQQIYSVQTKDGLVQRPMTQQQVDALKAKGVQVWLVGGSTP
jgi:hypothetical protein